MSESHKIAYVDHSLYIWKGLGDISNMMTDIYECSQKIFKQENRKTSKRT